MPDLSSECHSEVITEPETRQGPGSGQYEATLPSSVKFWNRSSPSHTMQGDACPVEWYISNGHFANLNVR